jgi:hypothetical protein
LNSLTSFGSGHVDDSVAGLRYLHPSGWSRQTSDLVSPLTNLLTDGGDKIVASGRWQELLAEPPSTDELMAGAAWLASEYGEYYLPYPGERVDVRMERSTAAGRPAGLAGYRLVFGAADRDPAYVRVLVIALAPDLVSFLLAVAPATARPLIDEILASAQPLNL